ncbi:hypothetical protein VTI74DRAFT_6232 [Chaetomium olivicolor]
MVPKKFRSVREKNGHRRSRSSEAGTKARPLTADSWLSIFKTDSAKQAAREKEEEEKVDIVAQRLEELNFPEVTKDIIRLTLRSNFAAGDVDKAIELVQLQQQSFSGIIQRYDPNVEMLGAENRGNVTCYLDSLLFAMFAHLTAFESMLKQELETEEQRKLAALLRLWVNMLRSGKLIHTDMTQRIQESLAACGWRDAALLEQQDTSEAFAFIADALQLPLLALQVDLFHQGKKDADDHKVVHERLLNLAVPPDPEGRGVKLEDCLEEYFNNNKVDVLRDRIEEKKSLERPSLVTDSTIRTVPEDDDETPDEAAEAAPLQRRWTTHGCVTESPVSTTDAKITSFDVPSSSRARSTSIIQRIVVDQEGNSAGQTDPERLSLLERVKRTGSSVVKAVTIPAWQFYRLIPWNATSSCAPKSDLELAQHFNQRPVVAICLKRYTMTGQGIPIRHNTLIDIPESLRLPHFMVVDTVTDDGNPNRLSLSQGYKLVLQSVVCHRGESLHSGHYVAYARVAPKLLTENRRVEHDPPPDYEEAQWVKFDDLAIEKRVQYVDDIRQALKEDMAYLLIYQIVPMVDVTAAPSTSGSVTDPPSYLELATYPPGTPSVAATSDLPGTLSNSPSGYFDSAATLAHSGPHIRFSQELERPPRFSFEDDSYAFSGKADSPRRGSITFSEPVTTNPSVSPDVSPSVTPAEESTTARLSRAAAIFKPGSSKAPRPTSQAGEGRISLTMSRFGFGRGNKDNVNGAVNGSANGTNSTNGDDQTSGEGDEVAANASGKEKEHHGMLHHHHQGHQEKKKDKGKDKEKERKASRSRDREEKKKDKSKGKSKAKDGDGEGKEGVPDRECVIM